jgi:hypothetical protein
LIGSWTLFQEKKEEKGKTDRGCPRCSPLAMLFVTSMLVIVLVLGWIFHGCYV